MGNIFYRETPANVQLGHNVPRCQSGTKGVLKMINKYQSLYIFILAVCFSAACTSLSSKNEVDQELDVTTHLLEGDPGKRKSIFVFLDGTSNNRESETNVWRLFQELLKNGDPQMTAVHIAGVGGANDAPITGQALGRGMQARILRGYAFISSNFNSGDKIFIFGFSRGAHQARSLAGLISYAGVLSKSSTDYNEFLYDSERVIEIVKKKSDANYLEEWKSWRPGNQAVLSSEIKDKLNIKTYSAEITFLGVWDTVPGSSLKNYGVCKEKKGFIKNYFWWLIPGTDKGERYKTDTYPPINKIAHAVSTDEKRSKFSPILICKPINSDYTQISEVWFPGAHSDVGGGYEDSNDLPSISLEWMFNLLRKSYDFSIIPTFKGNAGGLAHWSIGDSPANALSDCTDRTIPRKALHTSYFARKELSPAPVLCDKEIVNLEYPVKCAVGKSCPDR